MQRKSISAVLWQNPIKNASNVPPNVFNSFYRTVTHGESHGIFTNPSRLKTLTAFPHIHYKNSSFSYMHFFFNRTYQVPSKDVLDFNRSWKASSHVIFPLPLKCKCSLSRPWCPNLSWIRSSTEWFIDKFFFRWSLSAFESRNKNPPKQAHAISTTHHPPSISQSKSRRHMNLVVDN